MILLLDEAAGASFVVPVKTARSRWIRSLVSQVRRWRVRTCLAPYSGPFLTLLARAKKVDLSPSPEWRAASRSILNLRVSVKKN